MIGRKKLYNNESAVSVLVGTLMMILVIVVGSMAIATIYSGLSKETNDKIGVSASVIDRGTPVYIAGSPEMVGLVKALAIDFSKSNPTLYITTGSMDKTAAISFLYNKGIDAAMYTGSLPVIDPNYNSIQIGESCNGTEPDGTRDDFGNATTYGIMVHPESVCYGGGPCDGLPGFMSWQNATQAAKQAYHNNPVLSPQNISYCYPLYLITKNDDITVKPFIDYSRSTAARDTFNSVYRTSITDL
jgi:hypothetical protein